MTEDFTFGPKAAEALFDLWIEARISERQRQTPSNSLPMITSLLSETLNAAPRTPWSRAIRRRMGNLD
jgi:hypothetical protein